MSDEPEEQSGPTTPVQIRFRMAPGLANQTDLMLRVSDPTTATVADLKDQLGQRLSINKEDIRLVHAGRIYRDDEATVKSLGITDDAVIHVSRVAARREGEDAGPAAEERPRTLQEAAAANQRNSFGLGDMSGLLENPMVRSLLESPEFMQTMLENDPRIARLAESNPQLRQTLNDPRFLREMMETMRNPALSQEMMRNVDRQLLNIENIPGGFNALSSMYHDIQAPLSQAHDDNPSTEEANRRYAAMLGAQQTSTGQGPNNAALPNPWAAPSPSTASQPAAADPFAALTGLGPGMSNPGFNPFAAFGMPQFPAPSPQTSQPTTNPTQLPAFDPTNFLSLLGGAGGQQQQNPLFQNPFLQMPFLPPAVQPVGTPAAAAAATPSSQETMQAHEDRFKEQLTALREMGFVEKDKCIRALLAAGGNVEAAIAYMLDSL
ncbi:uncharacterized protein EV422DRAFT_5174 [Fimicolochytrium jonesii]|uniref:uncharacterized protein n=1 Tax=Fimicolochytrium jonesii TaxID=1396493 RepID=UPI0022FF139D|nr:uncharacterized protein EV422DRAFT_5174 [Fimicolochytrium jonesii]KAI8826655.1 hypothetical protein EV422DRAFT_5174 [Fimicolochytrium jonesii]